MNWIKFEDESPELNVPVLSIIQFLKPPRFACARVGIGWVYGKSDSDVFFRFCCHIPHGDEKCGGQGDYKVLYWTPFPKLPEDVDIDLLITTKD